MKLKKNCKLAYKKSRADRGIRTIVLEFTSDLRNLLTGVGRVYVAWEVVEACDFVSVTCCSKCQQYGPPRSSAIRQMRYVVTVAVLVIERMPTKRRRYSVLYITASGNVMLRHILRQRLTARLGISQKSVRLL
ncbi:hypothetical protein EVAR_25799_1 [Eumeta japonica]|uniref:Uncharacterized protein n=1 Tax=Eumeta variegata TaxID=151549 RepID=A0A4C1VW95_EUMVA|nr:hypothetical protein EVAR_25799_1 [Eumeta japonica]